MQSVRQFPEVGLTRFTPVGRLLTLNGRGRIVCPEHRALDRPALSH